MYPSKSVTAEEKQSALAGVLNSQTFARCDQLKRFLAFICDLEMQGKVDEISEYLIGIDVFGRPDGYSTGDDSVVRSRAHALRKRLEEFYAKEMPAAPVRIELAKGSYCPRFLKYEPEAQPSESHPSTARRYGWKGLVAACAFGFLLAGLVFTLSPKSDSGGSAVDPILRDAWRPLLDPGARVLVCIATPSHLLVRPYPAGALLSDEEVPLPEKFVVWYKKRYSLQAGNSLVMRPTQSSPLWGDAAAAMEVIHVLSKGQVSFEIIPERTAQPFVLRGKNVILFGRPEYSPAADLLLRKARLNIRVNPEAKNAMLPSIEEPSSTLQWVPPTKAGPDRGLITVLRSQGSPDEPRRTVVISGVSLAGTMAAAEFFCSSRHLHDFKEQLQKEGISGWPRSFQVLVATRSDRTLPLDLAYETHRVLER